MDKELNVVELFSKWHADEYPGKKPRKDLFWAFNAGYDANVTQCLKRIKREA